MASSSLFRRGLATLRDEGPGALGQKGYHRLLSKWFDYRAENVFDREWEVLLVLDGCRVDALASVADEYQFLNPEIPSIVSVGGASPVWLARTFVPTHRKAIHRTTYLSANPHTRRVLGPDSAGLFAELGTHEDWTEELGGLIPVWEQAWDDSRGTVPARAVTDRLVRAVRTGSADRYIAHYMQPHFPSIPDPIGAKMNVDDDARWEENVWDRLADGDLTRDRVWESYMANLRYVLDEIEIVLSNVESEDIVITADHGNAFGERGAYGHGADFVNGVRRVPWVTATGTDEGTHEPEVVDEYGDVSVDEQLEALGYK